MGNVDYSNFHNRAIGSSGGMVKHLQNLLNKKGGYELAEDGIFGSATEAAVRDFQRNNGLDVDGIIGVNTLKALQTASDYVNPSKKVTETKFEYDDFSYKDYEEGKTVAESKNALDSHLKQQPGEYKSQWQNQLDETLNKILNREEFSYNFNEDALYQQYKDKYIKQGKMAMQDTIGQASAMTGGYGNSYAQSVGNQAYQASLEQLNDVVPELYQMALDRYNQKGQDLLNQYALLGDQENQDYGRYRDQVGDWQTERGYLADRYDNERVYDYDKYTDNRNFDYGKFSDDKSYAYQNYRDGIADQQWKAEFDEAKRQYNEQMAFQRQQYNDSKNTYSGGSSGGSGGGSSGGSSGGSYNSTNKTTNKGNEQVTLTPKKSDKTTSFIGNHQTKSEFMARGDKTYKQYVEYIEGEIEKAEGNLSDEEILYLINYYGLS